MELNNKSMPSDKIKSVSLVCFEVLSLLSTIYYLLSFSNQVYWLMGLIIVCFLHGTLCLLL